MKLTDAEVRQLTDAEWERFVRDNEAYATAIERGEGGPEMLQAVKAMLLQMKTALRRHQDGSETILLPAISLIALIEDIARMDLHDDPKQNLEQRQAYLWKQLGLGALKENRDERDTLAKAAIYKLHDHFSRIMESNREATEMVTAELVSAGTPKSTVKKLMAQGKKERPGLPYREMDTQSILQALERENARFKKRGKAS